MATKQIGAINVGITASTKALAKDLTQARGMFKRFAASVGSMAATTSKAALAIGGAAVGAATGLGLMWKSQAEGIDQTAKLADTIGATTEGLIGLQHAAEKSGGLEALEPGLKKMTANLGAAMAGSKEAAQAFSIVGGGAAKLAGMNADAAFIEIAEAISKLPTAYQQTAAAQKIFGRGGVELLGVLKLGKAGLAAMRQEAGEMGKTLSRIDAAKVEGALDALTDLASVFKGIQTQLTVGLAPAIEATAIAIRGMSKDGEGIRGMFDVGNFHSNGLGLIANGVQSVALAFKALQVGINGAVTASVWWVKTIATAVNAMPGVKNRGFGIDTSFLQTLEDEMAANTERLGKELQAARKSPWWSEVLSSAQNKNRPQASAKSADKPAGSPLTPLVMQFAEQLKGFGRFAAEALQGAMLPEGSRNQTDGPISSLIEGKERGTIEAFRAINERQNTDDTPKKQLAQQQKGNDILNKMLVKLGQIGSQASNATVFSIPR